MKERIVLEIPKDMCDNCNGCDKPTSALVECYLDEPRQAYETVKVPETFEELKEMCKKEDMSKCDDEIKIKWHNNTSLFFYEKDGEIICKDEDSCIEMIIGYDRTPSQMWTIIKNL